MNSSPDVVECRAAYAAAVVNENVPEIISLAHKLLRLSPTLGVAQQILNTVPVEFPGRAAVVLRVAFLRSYTVEPTIPLLRALARLYGVELSVKTGEFNSYAQEIIDPASWLYAFDPHIVIFAIQTRDIAPDLWLGKPDLLAGEVELVIDGILAPLLDMVGLLRSRIKGSMVIQSFESPLVENAGLLDSRRLIGQAELIRLLNRKLNLAALGLEGVFVLDYESLISRHGKERWTDEKKWLTSRAPISADCLIHMAREYLRFVIPLAGRQSKVLVVDLDNTLWGGVVGEDGLNGIKIGNEYPGASFLALQRAILDLHDRGILLAICSKNNEAEALEALKAREEMLLRPRHFAAFRINWMDKAQNIRDIAAELNVGLDSVVFIDDNPVERQRVKQELPEVEVIDLPADPARYASALRASPVFERLSLTVEDRERGRYYVEQRHRKELETGATSLQDFYRSLKQRAEIVGVAPDTLIRIAQLTQKTNQLNMTTRRYTDAEVQQLTQDARWKIFGVRILDKFGDNGIVGVAFVWIDGDTAQIDTFLLSCRVIGRTVETLMLAQVDQLARMAGCRRVAGWFLPTQKNTPAREIYSSHGFTIAEQSESGTLWELDLSNQSISKPDWIGLV